MANNKYCGTVADYRPVSEDQSRVVIMYDLKVKEDSELAEWYQVTFYKKKGVPTLEQVKQAVIQDINSRVKTAIISGFTYEGNPVWLSEENQLNFSQAVTPATLKIGEQQDGTPIYKTFIDAAELKAFNDACSLWRQQCLAEGYNKKDGIDWAPYEAYFPITTNAE